MSTDVLGYGVSVVKIEDMIIQSRLWWYGHFMRAYISSQIREVMEVEITGKRKKDRPRKLWEECVKKDLKRYGLRREMAKNGENELERKLLTLASRDNDIKRMLLLLM